MAAASSRGRAQEALRLVRELIEQDQRVFGSGLTKTDDEYSVKVMTRRSIDDLPTAVLGIPVVQEVGEPPQAWGVENPSTSS